MLNTNKKQNQSNLIGTPQTPADAGAKRFSQKGVGCLLSKVSSDSMMNADMVVELLRPQLEVTTKDIEPIIIMGLYHHRDLIGSPSSFIKSI